MLVTDAPMLPVGALCVFDFKLPNGEIVRGTAEVVRHGRDKKIIVFKRKRRKNYRRKQGHRQGFTEVRVDEILV